MSLAIRHRYSRPSTPPPCYHQYPIPRLRRRQVRRGALGSEQSPHQEFFPTEPPRQGDFECKESGLHACPNRLGNFSDAIILLQYGFGSVRAFGVDDCAGAFGRDRPQGDTQFVAQSALSAGNESSPKSRARKQLSASQVWAERQLEVGNRAIARREIASEMDDEGHFELRHSLTPTLLSQLA